LQESGAWPEPIPTQPVVAAVWDRPPHEYSLELYTALIKHDEMTAGDKLREAQAVFNLPTLCLGVIVPCLVRIGEAWERGDIRVATEHFASAFIRGKLLGLLQSYPMRRGAPLILSGCPPEEHHEIGSLILALLLRKDGYRVEYLGPDLPLEDLVEYSRFERPRMVCLAVTMREQALQLRHLQDDLKQVRPVPIFGFGGHAFNAHPDLQKQVPGYFLGASLDEAVHNIHTLLDN
jgi:methanogenic corrinoid protein MtbC1